jgi:hypothetical protein
MALFQKCRCLQCGSALPLRVLWNFARVSDSHALPGYNLLTRSGLLRGNIGIVCPSCGAKFRIVQTRIQIVRLIIWGLILGAAWYVGEWSRRVHLPLDQKLAIPVLLVGVIGVWFFERTCIPRLAQVRPASDAEELSFPLRPAYDGASDRGSGEFGR